MSNPDLCSSFTASSAWEWVSINGYNRVRFRHDLYFPFFQDRSCRISVGLSGKSLRSAKGAARTPNQSRNRSRRTPFCASSSEAQRVRRAPPNQSRNRFAPHSVLREFLRSAKGAARTPEPIQEPIRAALRFARVPQKRKGCGAHPEPIQEPIAPRSVSRLSADSRPAAGTVLREFLRSAKGAARTPNQSRIRASSSGAQRVRRAPPRTNPGTDRAALRFARVPQESRLIKRA